MKEPTVGQVLDLIERWQHFASIPYDPVEYGKFLDMRAEALSMDIPALRALTEQHAAQLRKIAGHDDVINVLGRRGELLEHAANFLAAPRREPEAE